MKTRFFIFAIFALVTAILVDKKQGNKVVFDVRYRDLEKHDQSAVGGKVYVFQKDGIDIKCTNTVDEMGLIRPKLLDNHVYYVLGVDTNSRGNIYKTVAELADLLNYTQQTHPNQDKIKAISELWEERSTVEFDVERLKEIDDKALSIAKTIDLSNIPKIDEIFNFEFLDTDNIKGKYIIVDKEDREKSNNFLYLQDESDIHIY